MPTVVVHDCPAKRTVKHIVDSVDLGLKYATVLGFDVSDPKKHEWYHKGDRVRLVNYHTNLEPSPDKALNQLFLKGTAYNKSIGLWFVIQDRMIPVDYLTVFLNRYDGYTIEFNFSGKKPSLRRLWAIRSDTAGHAHYILIRSIYSDEKAMFREVKRNGLVE